MSLILRGEDFDGASAPLQVPVQQQPSEASSSAATVPKRLKACLGCKELKLRCLRNEQDPDQRCQRCVKTRRECIIPAGKKRSKKAGTSAVAVLEQKIDALVASLSEIRKDVESGNTENLHDNNQKLSPNETFKEQNRRGLKRSLPADRDSGQGPPAQSHFRSPEKFGREKERIYRDNHKIFSFFMPKPPRTSELFETDVVHRGLVTLEDAERVFQRFTNAMLPKFPLITFHDATNVSTLRRTKPSLFLAILGAASSILGEEVQKMLVKEIRLHYADRFIVRGERDLDLVQAVQVSMAWFYPPENFEEIQFFQFAHISTVLAIEMGFGQESLPSRSKLPAGGVVIPNYLQDNTPPLGTLADRQRAWLVCYFLCGLVAMTQRKQNMLPWTPYMDKCLTALESPPDALNSDKFLCQYVRGQQIAEIIGQQFCMDDPAAKVDILDVKVQYVLRGLEQQVDRWRNQIPPEVHSPLLQCSVDVLNLYLHEIVLHVGHNINDFKPPFTQESFDSSISGQTPQARTPVQQNALVACIMSVKSILDIFSGLDIETMCSMPMFNFVRTAYTVVVLIKIHVMALRPKDGVFGIVDINDLKVEFYLDRILGTLRAVIQQKKLRIASIFHLVVELLREWFRSQCHAASEDDRSAMRRPDQSHAGWSDHIESSRIRNMESSNIINPGMPTYNTTQRQSSTENAPPLLDLGLPMPETQQAEWSEADYPGLFYQNDMNLLESALGWVGGFV